MVLHDYSEILKNIQKKIGSQFLKDSSILNVPGRSTACKIDPFYYLALYPSFFEQCSIWTGFFPDLIQETLIRTGNIVLNPSTKEFLVKIKVKWPSLERPLKIKGMFLVADFIDQAIKIYARAKKVLPVSELKIDSSEKEKLDRFFKGKTPINNVAFG